MTFPDPVAFRRSLPGRPFSPAWEAALLGIYGRPMDGEQRALFKQLSGGVEPQPGGWQEAFINAGRGAGKDDTIKTVANYECAHGGHEIAATPGQRLPYPIICPLRNQGQGTVRMTQGEARLPQLKRHVAKLLSDSVEYRNGTAVQVWTCDDVAVVGDTTIGYCRNEWALWPGDDAVVPGSIIESNLRPTLRRPEGAPVKRVIGLSSSYTKDGDAWRTFRDYYGKADSPVLVLKGTTLDFNPNTDRAWLANERKRLGEAAYAMHFECEWRDAITEGWFGPVVDRCVDRERESSPPDRSWKSKHEYVAAIDAAFRGDRFALAIAHRQHRDGQPALTVLDHVRTWQARRGESLEVAEVVSESSKIIRDYRAIAFADQFAIDPLKELYRRHQVQLWEAPWTSLTKPQRFGWVRANMTDGHIRLCDHRELINEFHSVQGRLLKTGGERLEARVGHDDLVHAAVTALFFAGERSPDYGEGDGSPVILRIKSKR